MGIEGAPQPPEWSDGDQSGHPECIDRHNAPARTSRVAITACIVTAMVVAAPRSCRDCGWLATINDSDSGVAGARMISVERDRPGSDLDLRVRTYDSDGTLADLQPDDAFTPQVLC